MPDTTNVAQHYTSGSLIDKIQTGLDRMQATMPLDPDILAPVDEFHIGGRQATVPFMAQLNLTASDRVLDLGCGLGGPARYVAQTFGAQVDGIDLTQEFVDAGQQLSGLSGLQDRVTLRQGSILDLPYPDNSFDAAYLIHVGMNIADKALLMSEAARVLRPGGRFGIYDVMLVGDPDVQYPVPWAATADLGALSDPATYKSALSAAGFTLIAETDRTGFAKDFFAAVKAAQSGADGPPPLGLHLVMGADAGQKVGNMIANIKLGRIAPVELIATRDL